jgi:hypothetical protein
MLRDDGDTAPAISNCVPGPALETTDHIQEIAKTIAQNFLHAFINGYGVQIELFLQN